MASNILDEFNEILKNLDDLSPDKIQDFMARILELFRRIHFNAEKGTAKEKKEALDFASQMQDSFSKLQLKLDKNPFLNGGQFKNLFAVLEEDIVSLSKKKEKGHSSLLISKDHKPRKKKKVVKKV